MIKNNWGLKNSIQGPLPNCITEKYDTFISMTLTVNNVVICKRQNWHI